jgi:glutamyl-tRNA synthetase/glutamyl-Q tRNA(Asp) synthetase
VPNIIRFAPSPTGYLHEGHLLSALYVWAAALKWGLKIHLRIEDHDQSRARSAYITGIREDLAWLGFHYDSESIQSARGAIYETALQKLQAKSLVYPCFCSRKQLQEENPRSETGEIIYQGKCFLRRETRDERREWFDRLTSTQLSTGTNRGKVTEPAEPPHNLRFIVPNRTIDWHDVRLGDFHENPKLQCGDFPIRDRDNQWTYQFAVCVDDIDEHITHIVRGEDIRNSTARQIALMEALGRTERPFYLHHPLIVDENNKKLSKRELAHSLRQDKEAGITPETLFGRVCHKAHLTESESPLSLQDAIALVASTLPDLH